MEGRILYSFPLREAQARGYFSKINYYSVIDFETFCQAEPEFDLGSFCGYLPSSTPSDWRESPGPGRPCHCAREVTLS